MTGPEPPHPETGPPVGPNTARRIVRETHRALVVASLLALFGLAVTFAHFLLPSPLMFTLFMTVGQGAFVLGVLIYLWVILRDLRRRRVL
ncbi:MAG TPA: hypothetical protein VJS20_05035 [Gemmatimonadales bacterium]|nr:hypothetical protein [Gemmatimonadales bacterium]